MLVRKDRTLKDVVEVLKVVRAGFEDEPGSTQPEDGSPSRKEILGGLITFLEAC